MDSHIPRDDDISNKCFMMYTPSNQSFTITTTDNVVEKIEDQLGPSGSGPTGATGSVGPTGPVGEVVVASTGTFGPGFVQDAYSITNPKYPTDTSVIGKQISLLRAPNTYHPSHFGKGIGATKPLPDISAVVIGDHSGASGPNNGVGTIAIGMNSGQIWQQNRSIACGQNAGFDSQGVACVSLGYNCGYENQGNQLVAGYHSGNCIAIGTQCGYRGQGTHVNGVSIAGFGAGNSIGMGFKSAYENQAALALAVGSGHDYNGLMGAGAINQGYAATAIGPAASTHDQGNFAVSVGYRAGQTRQGDRGISIGCNSSMTDQGPDAISVGASAGETRQGSKSLCLGYLAGQTDLGESSIAIGSYASRTNTNKYNNTIVISAKGSVTNPPAEKSCVITPVRNTTTGTASTRMYYNNATGEVTWGSEPSSIKYKHNVRDLDDGYALNIVNHLRPVYFEYKDTKVSSLGLIAEEVADVLPEAVIRNAFDKDVVEGINYDTIIGPLIAYVKLLRRDLDQAKEMIKRLSPTDGQK